MAAAWGIIGALIFLSVLLVVMAWIKPDCRAGTVAMIGGGNGWVCVAVYKP